MLGRLNRAHRPVLIGIWRRCAPASPGGGLQHANDIDFSKCALGFAITVEVASAGPVDDLARPKRGALRVRQPGRAAECLCDGPGPTSAGCCPSCGARRMVQTAAHLVDRVIPRVAVHPVRGAQSVWVYPMSSWLSGQATGLQLLSA